MAIYSSIPPPDQQSALPLPIQTTPIDIQSWTATSALQALSISPSARGTGVSLSIPLDDDEDTRAKSPPKKKKDALRRDSMKRRDALLKGKEGSRRRQRWENDNLLHVPNAQPPLPSDWAPGFTHRVHHIPYYLAPLWDAGIRHRAEELSATKQASAASRAGITEEIGRVPTDLKSKLKKSKGAKTLLQDLELEIRTFVKEYSERSASAIHDSEGEADSEDEEIVFIGRDKNGNGITMSDEAKDVMEEELQRERVVYEGTLGEKQGGFARWLVHELAGYYGLTSRSESRGVRRVALVGVKERGESLGMVGMPRPLWGMV